MIVKQGTGCKPTSPLQMNDFHLEQLSILEPVIKTLVNVGLPVADMLQKAELTVFKLDDSSCYIPVGRMV